jgi:hypothetical protein
VMASRVSRCAGMASPAKASSTTMSHAASA